MSTQAQAAEADEPALTEEERQQRQIELNQPLIALLDAWAEDDSESEEEQRANLIQLMRGIDEHRKGGRELFAEYLKCLES